MEQNDKYEYYSAWRGKTLAAEMNIAARNGWERLWQYSNFKHCCWMYRKKTQPDA